MIKDINVVSSAAYVELFVNGQSLGYGTAKFRISLHLEQCDLGRAPRRRLAMMRRAMRFSSDTRVTVGPAVALRLTPILDPTGWKADGQDLALFQVETVDALGRRCPTNLDMINFHLERTRRNGAAASVSVPTPTRKTIIFFPPTCRWNAASIAFSCLSTTERRRGGASRNRTGIEFPPQPMWTRFLAVTDGLAV